MPPQRRHSCLSSPSVVIITPPRAMLPANSPVVRCAGEGAPTVKLEPGTEVDRYRVEAEIGRGGMARVYRVRHVTLDTLHALKVLTLSGEELRERLVREGKVQARLDHPNVVPVRDILDLPQGPGLLMDYIEGESLDTWLMHHDPDDAERERLFVAIARGVGFAHAQGVVHRDLKPGNVMMQERHGEWVPRVADFGLAKLLVDDEGDMLQSRTGRPMGTPAYMAPEQVRSAKHVDARADVFALGCILYELFCGHRAFLGGDSLEVFNRITQGRFRPPRETVEGLEPRIEAAIVGALAVHVDDRIPDCDTLLAVLAGDQAWTVASSPSETFFGDFGMPGDAAGPAPAAHTAAFEPEPAPRPADTLAPPSDPSLAHSNPSLAPHSDPGLAHSNPSLAPPAPAPAPPPSANRGNLGLVVGTALATGVVIFALVGRPTPTPPPAVQPEPVAAPAEPAPTIERET
ncbi:MAG: serine/threonine protein kinase, partial [Deltaproteobacteria bacterium]